VLLSPVPCLGSLHRLAAREGQGTEDGGREAIKLVNKQLSDLWKIPTPEGHSISEPLGRRSLLLPSDAWRQESLRNWIPSSRSLYSKPGRLSNLGFVTSSLLACTNSKFQRIWRRALVVAIPKPEKPLGDPKSNCPTTLLYVHFKILEILIYARVDPIIDPLLPRSRRTFHRGGRP